jgi:hypothetical protein
MAYEDGVEVDNQHDTRTTVGRQAGISSRARRRAELLRRLARQRQRRATPETSVLRHRAGTETA